MQMAENRVSDSVSVFGSSVSVFFWEKFEFFGFFGFYGFLFKNALNKRKNKKHLHLQSLLFTIFREIIHLYKYKQFKTFYKPT